MLTKEQASQIAYEGWLQRYQPIRAGALESNILGLWFSRQSGGKGVPATMTAGQKRGRWVGGDIQTNRDDGNENYSDNTLFGDTVDYVNTILGNGAPVLQAQPGILGYLSYLACGQETFSSGVNAVHTITVTGTPTGGSFTLTWASGLSITIPWNATSAQINTLLDAVFGASQIVATGGPLPGTPIVLTYSGTLTSKQPVALPVAVSAGLTGGTTPTATPSSTTTGVGDKHVMTPNDNGGFWSTWVKSVGKTTIHRVQYNDARITALRWEGSSASKVLKVTPTWLSLDPGVVVGADPSKTDDGVLPFIWTEAQGTITIDGAVYNGSSAFAAAASWGLQEWYGDDVTPYDVVNTRATLTLEGITILLDAAGITRYNQQIYNKSTPVAGDKPVHSIPGLGSYQVQFNKKNPLTGGAAHSFKFEAPGVKWSPDLNIPANPDGGAVELALGAEFRKVSGQPAFRVTVETSGAAGAGEPAFS